MTVILLRYWNEIVNLQLIITIVNIVVNNNFNINEIKHIHRSCTSESYVSFECNLEKINNLLQVSILRVRIELVVTFLSKFIFFYDLFFLNKCQTRCVVLLSESLQRRSVRLPLASGYTSPSTFFAETHAYVFRCLIRYS